MRQSAQSREEQEHGEGTGQPKKEREEEYLRDTKHFSASPVSIQTLSKIRAGAFSRANSKTCNSVTQRLQNTEKSARARPKLFCLWKIAVEGQMKTTFRKLSSELQFALLHY